MEYFKPVFTGKASLLYRNNHPKISFIHFCKSALQVECAVIFPAVCCLIFAGSRCHPHSKGRKSRESSPSLLASRMGSGFNPPRAPFQHIQLEQNWRHGSCHLQGDRQMMSSLGTIISAVSTSQLGQGWLSTASLTPAK